METFEKVIRWTMRIAGILLILCSFITIISEDADDAPGDEIIL